MYDGRGSVASLTGSSSSNIVSYTYNAYGEESKSGNTLNNPYRYNAEYTDSSTGYQYLRARYYNPATGRFLTKDTYLGTIPNPLSRNLYAYVENNPLNYIDPSGHAPLRTNPMRNMPLISPVDQMKIDNQIANQSFNPLDGINAATHPGGPKAYYDEKIENVYGEYFFGKGYSNPTSPYRLKTDSSLGYVSNRKEAKTKLQKAIDDRKINLHKTYCENGAAKAGDSGEKTDYSPLYDLNASFGYASDFFFSMMDTFADWSLWGAENAENFYNINPELWLDSQRRTIKTANDMKGFNSKFSKGLTIVSGIYDVNKNIKENEANNSSPKKVIIDILVDSLDTALAYGVGEMSSALAVTAVTAVVGALGGSVAPGVGNAIGLVAGIAAGIAFTYATKVYVNDNGNNVTDEVKNYLYDIAGVN